MSFHTLRSAPTDTTATDEVPDPVTPDDVQRMLRRAEAAAKAAKAARRRAVALAESTAELRQRTAQRRSGRLR